MASDIKYTETIGSTTALLRLQATGTLLHDAPRAMALRAQIWLQHRLTPITSLRFWHKAAAQPLEYAYEITRADGSTWAQTFIFAAPDDVSPSQAIVIAGVGVGIGWTDATLAPNRETRRQLVGLFVEAGLFDARFTYP